MANPGILCVLCHRSHGWTVHEQLKDFFHHVETVSHCRSQTRQTPLLKMNNEGKPFSLPSVTFIDSIVRNTVQVLCRRRFHRDNTWPPAPGWDSLW